MIFCGTLRIAKADFDTDPSDQFKRDLFDEICRSMNATAGSASGSSDSIGTLKSADEGQVSENQASPAENLTQTRKEGDATCHTVSTVSADNANSEQPVSSSAAPSEFNPASDAADLTQTDEEIATEWANKVVTGIEQLSTLEGLRRATDRKLWASVLLSAIKKSKGL